jgi:hypothetical protein
MSYESNKYFNGNLYASNAKNVNNQQLFMDLHVDSMDVKNQQLVQDLYVNIAMVVKNLAFITRPICKYHNGCKKTSHYYETYMRVL